MRTATLTLSLLLLATPAVQAACDLEHPLDCTVQELREKLDTKLRAKPNPAADAAAHESTLTAAVAQTEKKVGNQNKATTAPDPFASRLHNSYQDFVAPFSFAVNKLEESADGRALILRFNAIRYEQIKVGFTATAAKPTLYPKIKTGIPEMQRDDVSGKLDKKLKDLDDVTLAASFAFDNSECTDLTRLCFGRNPETYRNAISGRLADLLTEAAVVADRGEATSAELGLLVLLASNGFTAGEDTLLSAIKPPELQRDVIARVERLTAIDLAASKKSLLILDNAKLSSLATLLDNQPQISATASYRHLGSLGGPDEVAGTLEFQMGLNNLTRAARTSDLRTALLIKPTEMPSDKFVFSASYKRAAHYSLSSLTNTGLTVAGFTPIDVPRTSEWLAKAQWGRKIAGIVVGQDQQARFDLSAEFQRNASGGIRTKNRFVSTATLTVPFGEKTSIPLSIKYANKPEFLDDLRNKLSVHLGISYRFPWDKQ